MQAKTDGSQRHIRRKEVNGNKPSKIFKYSLQSQKRNCVEFEVNYVYLPEDQKSKTSKVLLCLEI